MTKKYKLHCFHRHHLIESKEDVCRDLNGYPVCVDCLHEILFDDWEDDAIENVMIDIIRKFNGNYSKFMLDLEKNSHICPECNGWHYNDYFVGDICNMCWDIKDDEKNG